MPRPGLSFAELREIWEAASRGEGPEAAWHRLARSGDIKPARAAYRVFERLQEDHRDGRPILTASIAEEVPAELRTKGVYPVAELARHARATGYGLKEPGLLRLMAVHNHMTILRQGSLPAPTGVPASTAPVYRTGHIGALMRARDRLHFFVDKPWDILMQYFEEFVPPQDPRFVVQEEADLIQQMLREHTQGHPFWDRISTWESAVHAYQQQSRDLIAEIERYALAETGMARTYDHGGETYGPQSPPSITKKFVFGPLDYILKVREGAAEGNWKFRIRAFGKPEEDSYQLDAGYGSTEAVAIGPVDQLERARDVQREIITRLREPSAIQALNEAFETCSRLTRSLESAKVELSEPVLSRGHCWACPFATPERAQASS